MGRRSGSTAQFAGARHAAEPMLADSVTQLDATARARTIVCGSHGGRFPAAFAAHVGVRGIIFNDAGVGMGAAGIAGLAILDERGVAAATVSHLSAAIGDAQDSLAHGVLSHVNAAAEALGCVPHMSTGAAAECIAAATAVAGGAPMVEESRHLLRDGRPRVWALDSASLADAGDAGAVLLTGSHGRLVGGRSEAALRVDALAAVFNDAGRRPDDAGPNRLTALAERRIPAATVDVGSARIGDGRSTYFDGVLSAVNEPAAVLGATAGTTARAFVEKILSGDGADDGGRR